MVNHQQILYKSKKSFKITKADPNYELPNYDYIQFNKEKTIQSMMNSSRLINELNIQDKEKIYLYRFRNKKYNIDIQTTHFDKTCTILNLKPKYVKQYIRSGEYYFQKDFVITRKLI